MRGAGVSVRFKVPPESPISTFVMEGRIVLQFCASNPIPTVSLVAPCFNEKVVLAEFHRRATTACRQFCGTSYEVVLVDDGSSDGTWDLICGLTAADSNVVGIRLMRNHGHQAAASAGLALARGDRVLLIDADLQDPPELLGQMMSIMDQKQADVVFGQRTARKGETRFKTASAAVFYRLLARLVAVPVPPDTGDFRLMRRRIVDALAAMPERQRFIRGMVSWIGGRQVPLLYERQARHAGATKYPFVKMVRFALDAITSFSVVPLRLATCIGFGSTLVALGLFGTTLWNWAMGHTVIGWTSLIAVIVFFGAVQLIVIGILGEYVGRIFQESKRRPLFLIDSVVACGCSIALPVEFANLDATVRREFWEIARGTPAPVTPVSIVKAASSPDATGDARVRSYCGVGVH